MRVGNRSSEVASTSVDDLLTWRRAVLAPPLARAVQSDPQ
jgi:hypothetical protein